MTDYVATSAGPHWLNARSKYRATEAEIQVNGVRIAMSRTAEPDLHYVRAIQHLALGDVVSAPNCTLHVVTEPHVVDD